MSGILNRLKSALFGREFLIRLVGDRQDDGYLYIYSSDLKGFSLMLEPNESETLGDILRAIQEPLIAYADEFYGAKVEPKAKAQVKHDRYQVVSFGKTSAYSYSARIGGACNNAC